VHLDPAGQVVEHVAALAPALGLVAGLAACSQKRAGRRRRAEALAQLLLGDALGMILLPRSIWPKPEPSSSRKEIELERQVEPSSAFSRQTSSA
jgi:hypothetical protein